ncbi:arylamine N-acetyltransferase [Peribacillus alkalitolerans]|uniref:arylamine N-acetyltransferase n=1 Tax=Peribacillus alkalitolerans TaxID=1550385 RepID=UPI0013D082E7|nr:arylamine N-acetyltransferase [Peribacillus alkalitolerans]
MNTTLLVEKFLDFLDVERKEVCLPFLNELLKNHQEKVKWETVTKILDWERGDQTGEYLPPIDLYINRITNQGMGGTCWSLAVGFHWLLTQLGFSTHYLYMDSGHLCLRVDLDQPYYVDVGYCAPLFKAYPLKQSFKVKDIREEFVYQVDGDKVTISREPGPTKTMDTVSVQLDEMKPFITKSNVWDTGMALKEIQIFGYVDGVPTSLKNNTLKQHFTHEKRETILNPTQLELFITERFRMDWNLYKDALERYESKKGIKLFSVEY